jgi:hypothetical protein
LFEIEKRYYYVLLSILTNQFFSTASQQKVIMTYNGAQNIKELQSEAQAIISETIMPLYSKHTKEGTATMAESDVIDRFLDDQLMALRRKQDIDLNLRSFTAQYFMDPFVFDILSTLEDAKQDKESEETMPTPMTQLDRSCSLVSNVDPQDLQMNYDPKYFFDNIPSEARGYTSGGSPTAIKQNNNNDHRLYSKPTRLRRVVESYTDNLNNVILDDPSGTTTYSMQKSKQDTNKADPTRKRANASPQRKPSSKKKAPPRLLESITNVTFNVDDVNAGGDAAFLRGNYFSDTPSEGEIRTTRVLESVSTSNTNNTNNTNNNDAPTQQVKPNTRSQRLRIKTAKARSKSKIIPFKTHRKTLRRPLTLQSLDHLMPPQETDLCLHDDSKWVKEYGRCKRFHKMNGHTIISENNTKDFPNLAKWAKRQRRVYKLYLKGKYGNMTEKRIQLLNKIDFCWNITDHKWDLRFEEVCRKIQTKKGMPRLDHSTKSSLIKWVKNQQKRLADGKLTAHQVDSLKAIGLCD